MQKYQYRIVRYQKDGKKVWIDARYHPSYDKLAGMYFPSPKAWFKQAVEEDKKTHPDLWKGYHLLRRPSLDWETIMDDSDLGDE